MENLHSSGVVISYKLIESFLKKLDHVTYDHTPSSFHKPFKSEKSVQNSPDTKSQLTWRKTTCRLRSASSCRWSSIKATCSFVNTTLFSSSFFSLSLDVSFTLSHTLPFRALKICPFVSNGLRVSDWKIKTRIMIHSAQRLTTREYCKNDKKTHQKGERTLIKLSSSSWALRTTVRTQKILQGKPNSNCTKVWSRN